MNRILYCEARQEYLKEKFYEIRGKKILLGADLAEIYDYDTIKKYHIYRYDWILNMIK